MVLTAMRSARLLLPLAFWANRGAAASVEIDPRGQQQQQQQRPRQIRATFVNALPATQANLYWAGNAGWPNEGSLQLYYGPLEANGGEFTLEGFEGQVFVLTEVGGYARLGEYRLGGDANAGAETFVLTEKAAADFEKSFPPREDAKELERQRACRAINNESSDSTSSFLERCTRCAQVDGCGFSPVRDCAYQTKGIGAGGCYASHAVATVNDVDECKELAAVEPSDELSAEDWLDRAAELTVNGVKKKGGESKALRMAYRCLEVAVDVSNLNRRATAALSEMAAKLEAVFDDADAEELLAASRHPKLAEVHPNMPVVPRRTASDATQYILRGEPVVITDLFDERPNPVAHKWTLEFLNREVFSAPDARGERPSFNVAADVDARCCRYFEPQGKAKQAEYPYPFTPTTHLYRDTFEGFVETVRKAESGNTGNSTEPQLLHYLHEIVMNKDGTAVVAGGGAPKPLVDDLAAVTSQLRPLAAKQPFFGDFAFAKVWLGQKGIVMPIHYDATDNLYVMAWGRKKAIIGEPGQLDALYRYPNGHPLVGSSQVNLTEADVDRFPRFWEARLQTVVVGPGDVLYLPAWWWHQFEQPFEDTAALNLWSRDREQAPPSHLRDASTLEHILADNLEAAITQRFGNNAGIVLDALANGERSQHYDSISQEKLQQAKVFMLQAARAWQEGASELPGGHPKTKVSAASLVEEHLDRTHRSAMIERGPEGWTPGVAWDLSQTTPLPDDLKSRCKVASESSPFMSICG